MKHIFIDANQYRHLFSRFEGFSEEVFQLLIKLIDRQHIKLLLPQQTKEEVERNRFRGWPESVLKSGENKIIKLLEQLGKAEKEFSEYKGLKKIKSEIEKQIKSVQKDQKNVQKTFISNHSKQNQKLRKLFKRAELIQETEEIRSRAQIRHQKGNPPYDKEGIGDSLAWESLLSHLPRRAHLIFVAHDNDAWGNLVFDKWLENEYKERVKGEIFYSKKLADIPDLTNEEQKKIRKEELENLKQNAVTDFINSSNFMEAGARAKKLLQFKENLNTVDYKEIFQASLTNHEIYQSFFTSEPLLQLITGDKDYVVKEIESVDRELWQRFTGRFNIQLKRQSDQQDEKEIDIKDLPF